VTHGARRGPRLRSGDDAAIFTALKNSENRLLGARTRKPTETEKEKLLASAETMPAPRSLSRVSLIKDSGVESDKARAGRVMLLEHEAEGLVGQIREVATSAGFNDDDDFQKMCDGLRSCHNSGAIDLEQCTAFHVLVKDALQARSPQEKIMALQQVNLWYSEITRKTKKKEKAQKKEQKCVAKEMRECKAAVKAVEKDDKLKKPMTAYWMWLGENRERISAMVGGKGSDVAKKCGELWKKLSEKEKAPYEARASKAKVDYDAYIATPEGAAALKAYKDATAAVAYKEKVIEADADEPALKKQRSAAAGA